MRSALIVEIAIKPSRRIGRYTASNSVLIDKVIIIG